MVLAVLIALFCSLQAVPAEARTTQSRWSSSFSKLKLSGPAAVSVTGRGRTDATISVGGGVPSYDAWSTIKIPLAMAALRRSTSATTKGRVERALRNSDNTAAAQLWAQLGGGRTAARRVDAVLRDYGDTATRTQSRATPGRSAYGRTRWYTKAQSRFMSRIACNREGGFIRHQLARTTAGPWGLMTFKRPLNKNGYGPVSGRYLVRQTALVLGSDGRRWGVSIEVLAPSLAAGKRDLTRITSWLRSTVSVRDVPARRC
jgi:hypothetical protein